MASRAPCQSEIRVARTGFRAIVPPCEDPTISASATPRPTLKTIGANGQISLGKHHVGRQVLVEEQEPGVWLIRTATVVPDNERWLQHPRARADLETALAWAQTNPPADDKADQVLTALNETA